MAIRKYFQSGNLTLSYLDFGGNSNKLLICLHGHFGNARMFSRLASDLSDWRVLSIDQRGHGWSEHPMDKDYSRESYVNDIYNFVTNEFRSTPVTILGHSLGGVNAYQFASRYPNLVNGMIIEDIGAEVNGDNNFAQHLPPYTDTLKELFKSLKEVGIKSHDYFAESVYESEDGWSFRFDAKGMVISHQMLNGSWWEDWTTSTCPALLIHGVNSWAVKKDHVEKMAKNRLNTKLIVFEECGHEIHDDDPEGFNHAVKEFLNGIR